MSKFKKAKGQVSSYDLTISILLFVILFVALRFIVIDNITSTENELAFNEMNILTIQAIDSIVKQEGYPKNWNENNIEIIGISKNNGSIDEELLNKFISLDYDAAAELLGISKYDFLFEIEAKNPDNNISFGLEPSEQVVVQRRVMMYKGGMANVSLKVFK